MNAVSRFLDWSIRNNPSIYSAGQGRPAVRSASEFGKYFSDNKDTHKVCRTAKTQSTQRKTNKFEKNALFFVPFTFLCAFCMFAAEIVGQMIFFRPRRARRTRRKMNSDTTKAFVLIRNSPVSLRALPALHDWGKKPKVHRQAPEKFSQIAAH